MTTYFQLEHIVLFVGLLARTSGLLVAAPFPGGRVIPRLVRALFAVALAVMLVPLAPPVPQIPNGLVGLALLLVAEFSVGLALGFVARLFVVAFEMAGQIAGIQMGLGMAQIVDPVQGHRSSVMARWLWLVGMMLFLTLNGHHHLLRALTFSLEVVPPGQGLFSGPAVETLIDLSAASLGKAMSIAAPAIGVLLLTSMGLGILARTVPQMNVFIVGFPIKITIGIAAVLLSLPYLLELARRDLIQLADRLAALVLSA